ncbi:MAG TPA: DUF4907 domain-containing protein [Ferruginibacter sp.]|nr:DUF4907 domain-containing protein [Ferruginibacter sp.]
MTKFKPNIISLFGAGFLVMLLIATSCTNNNNAPDSNGSELLLIKDSTFQSGTGWGYKIYVGDQLYINQPFIPGVPGKQYFLTESDAEKVAALVIEKIKQHHIPPTVSGSELRQLHIIE